MGRMLKRSSWDTLHAPCRLPSTADALMSLGHEDPSKHLLGSCSAGGEDAVVNCTNGALDSRMWVLWSRDGLSEQMMDARHLLCCAEDQMMGGPRGPS